MKISAKMATQARKKTKVGKTPKMRPKKRFFFFSKIPHDFELLKKLLNPHIL